MPACEAAESQAAYEEQEKKRESDQPGIAAVPVAGISSTGIDGGISQHEFSRPIVVLIRTAAALQGMQGAPGVSQYGLTTWLSTTAHRSSTRLVRHVRITINPHCRLRPALQGTFADLSSGCRRGGCRV